MKIREFLFLIPAVFVIAAAVVGFRNNVPIFSQVVFPDEKDLEDEGGITATRSEDKRKTESDEKKEHRRKERVQAVNLSADSWRDGTYTGTGTGYGGPITVEVKIENGKIKSIRVLSHDGETPEYFARAKKIIAGILREQTPDVNCIAGATLSSNGIRQAVASALNKAGGKKITTSADVTVAKTKKVGNSKSSSGKKEVNRGVPADGSYTGSAVCENFGYTLTLTARFKSGRAVSLSKLKITDNDDSENAHYWKMAWKPMVSSILKYQRENGLVSSVDTVSGATYSSNAIVNAYLNARAKAIAKSGGKNVGKSDSSDTGTSNGTAASGATTAPAKTLDDAESGEEQSKADGIPADGTYSVSADCEPDEKKAFQAYTLSADVTFQSGVMTRMENFTSTDESNRTYYMRAVDGTKKSTGVVEQLLSNQSARGLQAVTGATCSSKTIRSLYILAWNKATGSSSNHVDEEDMAPAATKEPTVTEEPVATIAPTTTEPAATTGPTTPPVSEDVPETEDLVDGTYTVSTVVYPDEWEDFDEYLLTGDVIFEGGKLKEITNLIVVDSVNEWYCNRALTFLLPKLVSAQKTTGVDACSDATCSSEALLRLYEAARSKAHV